MHFISLIDCIWKFFHRSGFLNNLYRVARNCPEIFHSWNIFYPSGFLSNLRLPWKTQCALNSLYWIYIFISFRIFEQLAHALKNRVSLKCFTVFKYFLSFRIFEQLELALKTEFALKFFTELNIQYFLSFRIFQQLALALKNRVAPKIFTVFKYFFIIQDFWATCACPEIFHCIEIFFSFRIFERLSLTLKFFKQGAVALPPCTPIPENICSSKGNSFVFLKPATMLNGVG